MVDINPKEIDGKLLTNGFAHNGPSTSELTDYDL